MQDFDPEFIRELRSLCSASSLFLGLFDGNQSLLLSQDEPLNSDIYEFKSRMFSFSNIRNSQEISKFVNRSCRVALCQLPSTKWTECSFMENTQMSQDPFYFAYVDWLMNGN